MFYHVVNTGHLFKTSDHTQISYKVLHNYNNNRLYCIFLFQYDIDHAMNRFHLQGIEEMGRIQLVANMCHI